MIPGDFRLYDLLDLAAHATAEASAGRLAPADHAWLNAWTSAEGLYPPGSRLDAAAGTVLAGGMPSTWRRSPC